jgi:hypothetical protein
MKYLIKYNEHILSRSDGNSHLFDKIFILDKSDLELGGVYKYKKKIEFGEGRGNYISARVRLVKIDGDEYHFLVIKLLTPNLAKLSNFKEGDIIISKDVEISKYYTIK